MRKRVKISAAYKDFIGELKRYKTFNINNQKNFSAGKINKTQFYFLTEVTFFNIYRSYENSIRDIFLLYTQQKKRSDGSKPKSHLRPTDIFHAEKMIRSSQRFLDWNSPTTIIERAELYLEKDLHFKTVYTSNIATLTDFKRVRNHIAHNSTESLEEYKKVLKAHYGIVPLAIPSVGEFLNQTSKIKTTNNILEDFFDLADSIISYVK